MKKENHSPAYSLPLQTIVGGRYLIQEFLEETEGELAYLAYDLAEKRQVLLTECYPQSLVTRDGEAGEEDITFSRENRGNVQQFIRQFETAYEETVRDHHTVYAVQPYKRKKPWMMVSVCLAVLVIGIGMMVSLFLPLKGQTTADEMSLSDMTEEEIVETLVKSMCTDEPVNVQDVLPEETITYSEYCKIYRPGYASLSYDKEKQELYYNNLLMVSLMGSLSETEKQELADLAGGEVAGYITGAMEMIQVKLPAQDLADLEQCAQKLMENEHVMYASTDRPVGICDNAEDNNPWGNEANKGNIENPGGNDWWAEAVDAYGGWEYTQYAQPIKVMVIDSGFSEIHQDMKIQIMKGNINQAADHGTHVAGLIGAKNNDVGIRGVADQAELLGIKWDQETECLLDGGQYLSFFSEAVRQGAKVVNMSFGNNYVLKKQYYKESHDGKILESFFDYYSLKSSLEENLGTGKYAQYIEALKRENLNTARWCMTAMTNLHIQGYDDYLLVQSAGNGANYGTKSGKTASINGFLASFTNDLFDQFLSQHTEKVQKLIKEAGGYSYFSGGSIVVGAVKNEKIRPGYYKMRYSSNYGSTVSICAPGENIYSTLAFAAIGQKNGVIAENAYGKLSGTSMAAPIVSGAAALVWSINPELEAQDVKKILLETAKEKAIHVDPSQVVYDSKYSDDTSNESWEKYMISLGKTYIYPMLNVKAAVEKAYALREENAEPTTEKEQHKETDQGDKPKKTDKDVSKAPETSLDTEESMKEQQQPDELFKQYLQTTLIPQYGIMSADPWKLSTSLKTWEMGDDSPMDGILSALISDLDDDGQEEMLVVRFTPGDTGRMYLEVYEAAGQTVSLQDTIAIDMSDYCKYRWESRLTVFVKEYQGNTSLYLYAYDFSGNDLQSESIQQMKYANGTLDFSKYWYFETKWDTSVMIETGDIEKAEVNLRQITTIMGGDPHNTVEKQITTRGADDNVDTSTTEYRNYIQSTVTEQYAALQEETGLTFKRCADTDMVNGMIAHTLIWSGRDLFYNYGEDDSTYVAALDNQCRDDVNTLVPFDYTEIVRK